MNETLPVPSLGAPPRIIPRAEHNISRSNISGNAVRVLYRLKEAGFQAFLVGGCVRDVMIGRHPKDFDVATNALPDQVRKLFRNSRLVGRRFRLAHVVFGREVIEVVIEVASERIKVDLDGFGEVGRRDGKARRPARQGVLDRHDPPLFWVLLDENVLHREIGGAKIMRDQLVVSHQGSHQATSRW